MQSTSYKFYSTSESAWQAMLLAIESAKTSIDLEQFIFGYDSIGLRFLDLLKDRARGGIRVRIFCDTVGSFSLYRSGIEKELIEAGVMIKFFNPIFPWHPNNETLWYFRDHRKLMIIDNETGFTGGACLGDAMKDWRESHVMITGDVVSDMTKAFEVMWHKTFRKFRYVLRKNAGVKVKNFRYLTNAPLPGKRYMYYELVRAIKAAKHYIYITTPYFLPDMKLLRHIKKASKRGVEVRLLVPFNANHKVVDIGMDTFFEEVLQVGVRVFRYKSVMIHAKTAVIDGTWSTIGSLNLDNLSLRYNFEGNIVSTDKSFAFELERQFLDDLKLTQELTSEEWAKRPLTQRLLEIIVWPIRKFL